MKRLHSLTKYLALFLMLNGISIGLVHAKAVKFEAIIVPKADATLAFKDDSGHLVRLVQREGEVTGDAPFAGSTMLEWGLHDLMVTKGNGIGYLEFTHPEKEAIYLKFHWGATATKDENSKVSFLLSGFWEVADKSGEMTGLGTLRINILSEKERQWIFEGDVGK